MQNGIYKIISRRRTDHGGFTLVEILIVVIILGILASILIPKFSNATEETREHMMKENLRIMRTQIGAYRAQHWDVSPGYDDTGTPSEATFIAQMTKFTDENGNTSDVGGPNFPFGPYLREIPENPITGIATITVIADGAAIPAQPAADGGWIYKPESVVFKAALTGQDHEGKNYYDY